MFMDNYIVSSHNCSFHTIIIIHNHNNNECFFVRIILIYILSNFTIYRIYNEFL